MTTPARRHRLTRRARVDVPAGIGRAERAVLGAWERAYNLVARDLERDAYEAALRGPLSRPDFRTGRLGATVDRTAAALTGAAQQSSAIVTGAAPAIARGSAEVQASYLFGRAGRTGINVNQLDPRRLRTVVERTTQTIASRYIVLSGDAERALRDELVTGVARGAGPRDVARRIVDNTRGVFGGGRARALNLARTELVDLSRRASAETYTANPQLVTGWRWSSALDTRTCPACWAMHNTRHDPDEVLEGHQSCRCVPVPILVLDEDDGDLGSGEAAFARLSPAEQRRVMGPGRLEALENGLPFDELVTRRDNPGWRPGHYVRPVRDLGKPRLDATNLTSRIDPGAGNGVPMPAPPAARAVDPAAAARVADELAVDTDVVDLDDLDAIRDELGAHRTLAYTRALDETGADLDLDPWLEDTLDGVLEPEARAWLAANPQPTLEQYREALRRREQALTGPMPAPAQADEWAEAWGEAELSLPRRARAVDDEAEYAVYRQALWLEAVEATNGRLAARGNRGEYLVRIEGWLLRGGRMPPVSTMSDELQEHLGLGEFGTARGGPSGFLSLTEWRAQRRQGSGAEREQYEAERDRGR